MTIKAQIILGIFFLTHSSINVQAVSGPTLKEYEEKFKSLPPKASKTEEIWGQTLKFIIQNESTPLLKSVLKHRPDEGIQSAWYRYDLLEIFKKKNQFMLQTTEGISKTYKDCLFYWLVPESKLVGPEEIESTLKANGSPLALEYLSYMKKNIIKSRPKFSLKSCNS